MQRYFLSLVVFTTILFSGCGVADFIGAYFNTFYNAQKQFNEAEAEVLAPSLTSGITRTERPFLAPFDVPGQSKTKFAAVIEKCSKLLQYHPESKLVDDALLMIGKSYYYQNEHQSAERKFKELLSSNPESDLAFGTKLLLANTYYRNNDKATAATAARQLMDEAKKSGDDGIVAKAALLIAHIEAEQKNDKDATEHFQIAADFGETPEERSAAYRSVAAMHIQQAEYKQAFEAFQRSEETSSEYVGVYRGQIGQVRMLSKLGHPEESLSMLDGLIKNTNYREFFGEIDLEIGNVYRDQNDIASAEAQYRYVDTAYARTETAANSYYQLGLMYEIKLLNYDSARTAYEKGKAEFPQAEITPAIVKRSEILGKYFTYRPEITKYDSIKKFILFPPIDTTARAFPDTSVLALADTTAIAVTDTTEKSVANDPIVHDSTLTAHVPTSDSVTFKSPAIPPPPMDTVQIRLAYNISELAGLFYSSLEVVDSAKYWYTLLLNEHPDSKYTARALYTLAQIYGQDSIVSKSKLDSLYQKVVDRFPQSEFAAESRRQLGLSVAEKEVDTVKVRYLNAESFVKSGDIATALSAFKEIAERDTTSPLAAKAQYTVGWLYENAKPNTDSSIAYYERLVKRFPNSQYATLVQPKLAEVAMEKQRKLEEATRDSVKNAVSTQSTDSTATHAVSKSEDEARKALEEQMRVPPQKHAPADSLTPRPNDTKKPEIEEDKPKP